MDNDSICREESKNGIDAIMKQYLILIHICYGRYSHNFSVLANEYLELHLSADAQLSQMCSLQYQTHFTVHTLLSAYVQETISEAKVVLKFSNSNCDAVNSDW